MTTGRGIGPSQLKKILLHALRIGVLGIVGIPKEVEKYVKLVKSHLEMLCQEVFKKEMNKLHFKMIEAFVQRIILFDDTENPDHIINYGKMVGYDLQLKRVCVIVDIDIHELQIIEDSEDKILENQFLVFSNQKKLIDYLFYIFRGNEQDVFSILHNKQFIIFKTIDSEEGYNLLLDNSPKYLSEINNYIQKKFNLSARISISDISNGAVDLPKSYNNAIKTLNIGKITEPSQLLYFYNDWEMILKLIPHDLNNSLQNKLIAKIEKLTSHENSETLEETFMTYCKYNMNLSQTAKNLFIHRNTLNYRLAKISEILTINIGSFEHCLTLYIALKVFYQNKNYSNIK